MVPGCAANAVAEHLVHAPLPTAALNVPGLHATHEWPRMVYPVVHSASPRRVLVNHPAGAGRPGMLAADRDLLDTDSADMKTRTLCKTQRRSEALTALDLAAVTGHDSHHVGLVVARACVANGRVYALCDVRRAPAKEIQQTANLPAKFLKPAGTCW